MGLLKIILAVFPFFRELFTNNKDLDHVVTNHKTTTALLMINITMFVLYLYAYNEARERDFVIVEAVSREKRLEEQVSSLDLYYKKRLDDREDLHRSHLEIKKQELDHYKMLLRETTQRCVKK